jgi:arginine exporter protein ArgO
MTEALLALVVDLSIAGVIFLIWYFYKESKTPTTEEKTKTAEAPTTQAPEKQFPAGTVIGIIVLIIVIIAIASVVNNRSDSSGNDPAKIAKTVTLCATIQNPDGSVTHTASADKITEVLNRYSKGQRITFTATGTATSTTYTRDGAYKYVGPTGWPYEPGFLQGRKKILQTAPFMSLVGKLENGEWFYIGNGKTITAKTSGEKISFVSNDALIDEHGKKHPEWMQDNCGHYTVTIKIS